MPDLGNLVEIYNQSIQYLNQSKGYIAAITGMLIIPAYLIYYNLRELPHAFRQAAITRMRRLGVPEVLGVPVSQIPNPIRKEEVVSYIYTGGQEGGINRRVMLDERANIKTYATRVRNGENPSGVLNEALRNEVIQGLFRRKL